MKYNVYKQGHPRRDRELYYANLIHLGQIEAKSSREAFRLARREFRILYPVLHELDWIGREMKYEHKEIKWPTRYRQ